MAKKIRSRVAALKMFQSICLLQFGNCESCKGRFTAANLAIAPDGSNRILCTIDWNTEYVNS